MKNFSNCWFFPRLSLYREVGFLFPTSTAKQSPKTNKEPEPFYRQQGVSHHSILLWRKWRTEQQKKKYKRKNMTKGKKKRITIPFTDIFLIISWALLKTKSFAAFGTKVRKSLKHRLPDVGRCVPKRDTRSNTETYLCLAENLHSESHQLLLHGQYTTSLTGW